ncbi:hypothetical protein evm_009114 [Chilo suppressalis]|nr:hypothetical protein evm_009114 [Chilo suppressalis]
MFNLVTSNFNKSYNPNGKQNALTDIKRLLTSRHTEAQNKACGYLVEVVSRYNKISKERSRMVEYLLDNDITVFLCEATSNLDYSLFRSVLSCLRLLWMERRFFFEEHASHSMAAVLRALAHYAGSGLHAAVELCLHFLCDLFDGISTFETISPLSYQSAYCIEQLLASLNVLASCLKTNPNGVLSSALVLHALVSYQPENLELKGRTAVALVEVIQNWFTLIMGVLNHSVLMGDKDISGMSYIVVCQLGADVLSEHKTDFVQAILTDSHEIDLLKESAYEMRKSIRNIILELVVFTKDYQTQISTEEYSVFLKFLLLYLQESGNREVQLDFCDVLFSKNYLTMLPHAQIAMNDLSVRKMSTLILGEILKSLADKYLNIDDSGAGNDTYSRDIQMGLVELQYGIEKPQSVGSCLQKGQPYCLLIYIYFYCQSTEKYSKFIYFIAQCDLNPHFTHAFP